MSSLDFNPLDQTYLSPETIRNEVHQSLAQLELEKHRIRTLLVVNEGDESKTLENGQTLAEALERVAVATAAIEATFADVLALTPPAEEPADEPDGE